MDRSADRLPPEPRELLEDAGGGWVKHWTSPGWLTSADSWVTEQLSEAGITLTGSPVMVKVRIWAVVRCYPTDQGLYWFKENNPGQGFEAALVGTMAQLLPQHVAHPLAVEPERGWFLTADQGPTLDHAPDADSDELWQRLVMEYAVFQRDTIPVGDALVASGLTVLEPHRLAPLVAEIADWFRTTDHPLRPDRADLDAFRRAVELVDRLPVSGIPLALEQNDLHARNVFSSAGRLRFFDFGDAIWAHPFATVEGIELEPARKARLVQAYLAQWTDLGSAGDLRREFEVARRLHPIHRLVSWYRLLVHADDVERAAWVEWPQRWVREVNQRFGTTP